ncbi:O-antigen ligase family protein [Chlamydiota bacterium]
MDKASYLRRFILLFFCVLLLFSPLFFGSVRSWVQTCFSLLIFTSCLVFVLYNLKTGNTRFSVTPIGWSLIILSVYIVIQVIPLPSQFLAYISPQKIRLLSTIDNVTKNIAITVYRYASVEELVRILSYLFVFFLTINFCKTEKEIGFVLITIIGIGSFEALYGLYEWGIGRQHIFLYKKVHHLQSVTGTFINRNHFALYMVLSFFVSLGYLFYYRFQKMQRSLKEVLLFSDRRSLIFIVLILATMIMGITVFLTLSRGGIFSFFIALLCMFVFLRLKSSKKQYEWVILLFIVVLVLLVFFMGMDPLLKRFQLLEDQFVEDYLRFTIWYDTLEIVRNFPLLGTGAGTYPYIFRLFQTITDYKFLPTHAHNDFLEILSDYGIIGFLVITVGFLLFFIKQIKLLKKRRNPAVKRLGAALFAACIAVLIHSFFDFGLRIPANAYLFFVILGLFYRVVRLDRKD